MSQLCGGQFSCWVWVHNFQNKKSSQWRYQRTNWNHQTYKAHWTLHSNPFTLYLKFSSTFIESGGCPFILNWNLNLSSDDQKWSKLGSSSERNDERSRKRAAFIIKRGSAGVDKAFFIIFGGRWWCTVYSTKVPSAFPWRASGCSLAGLTSGNSSGSKLTN